MHFQTLVTVRQILDYYRNAHHRYIPRPSNGAFKPDTPCFICGRAFYGHH